jgi:hypothetical protein
MLNGPDCVWQRLQKHQQRPTQLWQAGSCSQVFMYTCGWGGWGALAGKAYQPLQPGQGYPWSLAAGKQRTGATNRKANVQELDRPHHSMQVQHEIAQ